MKNRLKRLYIWMSYYFPIFIKLVETLYYHFSNFMADNTDYKECMHRGQLLLSKITNDANYYYFFIDQGIGDLVFALGYAKYFKKPNQRVAFVVFEHQKDVVSLYDYVDKVVTLNKSEYANVSLYINRTKNYFTDKYKYCFFEMNVSKKGERNWSSAKWNRDLILPERYKLNVFHLTGDEEMIRPSCNSVDTKYILDLDKKYDIGPNSILIVPLARTVTNLGDDFWNNLVTRLNSLNYTIYTNIGNPENEKAIDKTIALHLSLIDLYYLSVRFKYIIAIRCGICDLVAFNSPKMIVINDYSGDFDNGDFVAQLSAKKTIVDIYRDRKSKEEIVGEILDLLPMECC